MNEALSRVRGAALVVAALSRRFSPLFAVGERVRLTCEGKAECGAVGIVMTVKPYSGPRMYADWECRLRDLCWEDGDPVGCTWTVRETWLELAQ